MTQRGRKSNQISLKDSFQSVNQKVQLLNRSVIQPVNVSNTHQPIKWLEPLLKINFADFLLFD